MKLSIKVEYTNDYLKFTLKRSEFNESDNTVFTEPPLFPPHRCLDNVPENSFNTIKEGMEFLFDGKANVTQMDFGENYFHYVIEPLEEKEVDLGKGFFELLNLAIPHFQEYIDLQSYLGSERWQKLLESEMETRELIDLCKKCKDENLEEVEALIKSLPNEVPESPLKTLDLPSSRGIALEPNLNIAPEVEPKIKKPKKIIDEPLPDYDDYDLELKNYLPPAILEMIHSQLDVSQKAKIFEFIRRVDPQLLKEQLAKVELDNLPIEYLDAFITQDFTHPIFNNTECDLLILYYTILGDISIQNASLLLLYLDAVKTVNKENVEIYDLEKDETSISILAKGGQGDDAEFSPSELEEFKKQLKNIPKENKTFFVLKLNSFCMDTEEVQERAFRLVNKFASNENIDEKDIPTILEFLYHCLKFRLMLFKNDDGSLSQVITSPNLYYHLLKVKFGGKAIRPNPVLGFSRPEDFQDPSKRDVLIPIRFFKTPKFADHFRADSFYHHDLTYHCFVDSSNPLRSAWIELAMQAKDDGHDDVWNSLLDRETPFYYNQNAQIDHADRLLTDEQAFWLSMGMAGSRMNTDYRDFRQGAGDYFFDMLLNYINENQESWNQKHGISIEPIESLYKVATPQGKQLLKPIKVAAAKINDKNLLSKNSTLFASDTNREPKNTDQWISEGSRRYRWVGYLSK